MKIVSYIIVTGFCRIYTHLMFKRSLRILNNNFLHYIAQSLRNSLMMNTKYLFTFYDNLASIIHYFKIHITSPLNLRPQQTILSNELYIQGPVLLPQRKLLPVLEF